jgi:hypothetical protein
MTSEAGVVEAADRTDDILTLASLLLGWTGVSFLADPG